MIRTALVTNTLAPYRLPVYRILARSLELVVLTTGREALRKNWGDLASEAHGFDLMHSRGLVISIPKHRKGKAYDRRYFHAPTQLYADLARIRPSAVISNEMGLRSVICYAYARSRNLPCWIWWGGSIHTERKATKAQRRLRAWFSQRQVRFISYGNSSTEYLSTLGIDSLRICQVQNCVDESLYGASGAHPSEAKGDPVILCVGNLLSLKGLVELFAALERLPRDGWRLLLVGEGPLRPWLEQQIQTHQWSHVRLHGSVKPSDMPSLYGSAQGLIFPTLDDVWGLVVNEAMWSGLPVMCSRYAGCAEELLPSNQIFDPLDPDEIEAALRSLIRQEIPVSSTDHLWTCQSVAEKIIGDITTACATKREDRP